MSGIQNPLSNHLSSCNALLPFSLLKQAKVIGLHPQSLPQPTFCPLYNTRTVEPTFGNSSFVLSLRPAHTYLELPSPRTSPYFKLTVITLLSQGTVAIILLVSKEYCSSRDEKCRATSHCLHLAPFVLALKALPTTLCSFC